MRVQSDLPSVVCGAWRELSGLDSNLATHILLASLQSCFTYFHYLLPRFSHTPWAASEIPGGSRNAFTPILQA